MELFLSPHAYLSTTICVLECSVFGCIEFNS